MNRRKRNSRLCKQPPSFEPIESYGSRSIDNNGETIRICFFSNRYGIKKEDMRNSGCTGVCVIILNEDGKRMLYSANAGDSRSVLYTNGTTIRLSFVGVVWVYNG